MFIFFCFKKKNDNNINSISNYFTNDTSNNFTNESNDILNCESGYFLTDNNKSCKKCSIDNCEKCYERNKTNFCIFCKSDFIPIYENGIIKFCLYHCETGKDEKCLSCDIDNIKCISCNIGYKLLNGKCISNYSFKTVYQTKNENENIKLIYSEYLYYILEMIIAGINVIPKFEHKFPNEGNHTVYFLLNNNISSLKYMFYSTVNIISIFILKILIQKI